MPRSFYRQLLIEIAMKQTPKSDGNLPGAGAPQSREQVLAEREAKRIAKQMARLTVKQGGSSSKGESNSKVEEKLETNLKEGVKIEDGPKPEDKSQKSREEILAERASKKLEKKQGNKGKQEKSASQETKDVAIKKDDGNKPESKKDEPKPAEKTKAQLKVERREKQEAQRAKKAEGSTVKEEKKVVSNKPVEAKPEKADVRKKIIVKKPTVLGPHRVKLFAHLYSQRDSLPSILTGVQNVHPCIARLGAQYRTRVVCGSNARCLALLSVLKKIVADYRTPANEELSRGLGAELTKSMAFLNACRPVAVSMTNAIKHFRAHLNKTKGSEEEIREELLDWIDTYVKDQLEKAAEAISISVRQKIADGDVILTYSFSSLIEKILIAAAKEGIEFRVIVVDGRPWLEGRELLRRLILSKIPCTYILVNALSFVMPEVTKILLGAHALLANGYVMSRAGSSQVALLARACNVPVLVCCETHKFSERVQTDSFVLNELGNPDELVSQDEVKKWSIIPSLTPLNLVYDVTPPDLVTAVVTELAVLPCTSVPVILRIK